MELANINITSNSHQPLEGEVSNEIHRPTRISSTDHNTFEVHLQWKTLTAFISAKDDPIHKSLYAVSFSIRKPHVTIRASGDNSVIGSSTFPLVSILPSCLFHDQPLTIRAQKRLQTNYAHISHSFFTSSEAGNTPMVLNWTTTSDFKTWDFICMDERQEPVARFKANWWALNKVGSIELAGEALTGDDETRRKKREELIVVGLTIFWLVCWRANNIFALFGAMTMKSPEKLGGEERKKDK